MAEQVNIDLQNSPFNDEQKKLIHSLLSTITIEQVYWLGGYFSGFKSAQQIGKTYPVQEQTSIASSEVDINKPELTILFGSRTGNGEEIANQAKKAALAKGFKPVLKDMSTLEPKSIASEKNMMVIVSTHGDGVAPLEAEDMYKYICNGSAPDFSQLNYSVCALGDKSYKYFCQTGKDFDGFLEKLGGKRVFTRADCDLDFEETSEEWIKGSLNAFADILNPTVQQPGITHKSPATATVISKYGKKNPFPATILNRIVLNGRGSEKETLHLELSLEESGLEYEPGDALGVYSENEKELVDRIIEQAQLNRESKVILRDDELDLETALTNHLEISILSRDVLSKYVRLSPNKELQTILEDDKKLDDYLYGRDVLDMITDFPVKKLTANELVALLRKLPARLYSIASSSKAHPGEVHLTVSAVRYTTHGRTRHGVCSTFLADRTMKNQKVKVYIDKNKNFKLPTDVNAPVIMVGPGTGVAPFRSFVEERDIYGGSKNWLFFGDQHFTTDFLYQLEWHRFLKSGTLTKLDVAFSRDQREKVYVQHKMKEQAAELWNWLEQGAHIYVCGDEKKMAKDVHEALIDIVQQEGGMTVEKASEYVKNLQKEKRYQEDVY